MYHEPTAEDRCLVCWNPGEWPYTTRCALLAGHQDDHKDRRGRTIPNIPGQVEAAS